MDRRLLPANGRVAAAYLKGKVEAEHFTEGTPAVITQSIADLLEKPDGTRDRQLLFGARVTEYDQRQGWSFVQAQQDGYVGYVRAAALSDAVGPDPTHVVCNQSTQIYTAADLKSQDRQWLSIGTDLHVLEWIDRFARTRFGFVPEQHLRPLKDGAPDLAATAMQLLGCPYLWGGNSSAGIDCSGLVQLACKMANRPCPADSDLQRTDLGDALPNGRAPRRNDLFFWPGHVALALDETRIIHANAHHMAVTIETLADAKSRIDAAGEGPLLAHKRLSPSSL